MDFRVALISMPFASLQMPSIGISLIKAGLEKADFGCDIFYLNLLFTEFVGLENYSLIADAPPTALAGEWVFSEALLGKTDPDDYFLHVEKIAEGRHVRLTGELLRQCQSTVELYLDHCLGSVNWKDYRLVGFTSVFEQNVASLALAKRLKTRFPHLHIVFGGANCEGRMGEKLLQLFPFVDAVCQGEGDFVVTEYVTQLENGSRFPRVDRMLTRAHLPCQERPKEDLVSNLDDLPYPNYDDYFHQITSLGMDGFIQPSIPFESSRGCWWGQKQHCTFCGLNGAGIAFRSKRDERVLEELSYFHSRYRQHTNKFFAVDNILDYRYFKNLLPRLGSLKLGIDLFYETKANLTREQLQVLSDAGFTAIQPGIESLITSVLKLMKKGVSLLQNVRLLRWCQELELSVAWNILYGFPGEKSEDYQTVVDIIQRIPHLQPPTYCGQFRLDRFSPYFQASEAFGLTNVRPCVAYPYVYRGYTREDLNHLAYYFEYDYADGRHPQTYVSGLMQSVGQWRKIHSCAKLYYRRDKNGMIIHDERDGVEKRTETDPFASLLLEQCDSITTPEAIEKELSRQGYSTTPSQVLEYLHSFLEKGWVLKEGDQYLSLVMK